jgi:hypothetical protein
MADPPVKGQEDLLEPSRVRVFGRVFAGLVVNKQFLPGTGSKLLRDALEDMDDPRVARIYGFSYGGHYYKLGRPTLLIVNGDGEARGTLDKGDTSVDNWGVEAKIERFADDVRAWDLDREDLTIRFDVDSGFVRDILIEPSGAGDADFAGRANVVARANLIARANVIGPGDMLARANVVGPEMMARHRFRE